MLTTTFEALRVRGCCREAVVWRVLEVLKAGAGRLRVLACSTGGGARSCHGKHADLARVPRLALPAIACGGSRAGGAHQLYCAPKPAASLRYAATAPYARSRTFEGRCQVCSRVLRNPVSVAIGIGPICRGRNERDRMRRRAQILRAR